MLSIFALVASLALLSEGAIELGLTRISKLSNNRFSSVNTLRNNAIPLGGGADSIDFSYVAKITVGGQVYRVTCDTGSSDLLIVGNSCQTYGRGTCDFQYENPVGTCSYNGPNAGSFSGTNSGLTGLDCYGTSNDVTFANFEIYQSNVTLAGVTATNQYIGYITAQSEGMWGGGDNALDGILGLAYNSISKIYANTYEEGGNFMSTMSSQNNLPNALALCFDPSGTGGKLVIGGGELENMQFTPVTLEKWYTVNMTSISVGGNAVENALGVETVVDSGTTEFIVPGDILDGIAAQLCPLLAQTKNYCTQGENQQNVVPPVIKLTTEQLATFPDIIVNLPGVTLSVPAQSYFMWVDGSLDGNSLYYGYGIGSDGSYLGPQGSPKIILGDVALMGNWVYFDTENARVGFSPVEHCNQQY